MARKLRCPLLETRSARVKLAPRARPYFTPIGRGIAVGYRKMATGAGSWSVRCADGAGKNWLRAFGTADDIEDAGAGILSFWEAVEKARDLARAGADQGDRPITIDAALSSYEADLRARGGAVGNVKRVRHALPAGLLTKPISLLTSKILRDWRNNLVSAGGLRSASADRTARALAAALTLAQPGNVTAWKVGLKRLPDAERARPNSILSDETVREVVAAAYTIEPAFGLLIEIMATTGCRSSQALRLEVGDLEDDGMAPRIQMPSSRKGRSRKVERKPLPITPALAAALRVAAAGRPDNAPLIVRIDGKGWPKQVTLQFRKVVAAVGLDRRITAYSLRHSSITRSLLAGLPVELVASSHDTSAQIISRHYAKYIVDTSDTLLRRAMLDLGSPSPTPNVVSLR